MALGLWKGHQLIAKIERFYQQDGLKFALGPMGRAIIALTLKEVDLVLSTQKVITKHQKKTSKISSQQTSAFQYLSPHLNICALELSKY